MQEPSPVSTETSASSDLLTSPPSERRGRSETSKSRDLLDFGDDVLSPVERWQIGFVRNSFQPGPLDRAIRVLQRHIGANWIEASVKNLRRVHGLDRLPTWDPNKSYVVVSNHRSFFDLYVITAYLVKRGMPHRLVFPVRSKFFYDNPAGFVVNGAMSFFAMYPPVFRERQRAALNLASLDEVVRLLQRGGAFVGLHPEGTRNKGDDPYALLPAQGGVGRIIQAAKVTVIPAFINGLGNDIVRQVASNFAKSGDPVDVVFGAPIDFGDMLDAPPSPRLHRRISEHALDAIRLLGEEDRAFRVPCAK
ncbi:1-acyl-sn-glycerol-3-phosphate acyltransferase [Labilithrix luteola]|uniref:1-acyl-sn-glycerol-3-phosphate acyltransferase n=1 Tax=Labilithrix luteola TaxID=1391654 RepID=A0A0K1PMI3_9BACT|nr:lysophospholipid acyltransferase family protein [Labilithrix luteola]AKU94324.1 1-acyl-sn-glycerol-3-phosphate acyltransferase [Labilithrix luteola]